MDDLSEIFSMQDMLMRTLGMTIRSELTDADLYTGDVLVACMGMASEAGEVLSEVNVLTRPWARKPTAEAKQALAEEAIDVFFFFVELFILLGLTPSDVMSIYGRKWKHNMERFRATKASSNT